MTFTRFIGDVHGKFGRYNTILKDATTAHIPTIQVGDMGVGFLSPYGIPSGNPCRGILSARVCSRTGRSAKAIPPCAGRSPTWLLPGCGN